MNGNLKRIDAHCHLTRFEALESLPADWGCVLGGIDPADWAKQRDLKARFGDRIWTAFGLHPWWVAECSPEAYAEGLELLETHGPEASLLGETGLDSLRANPRRQREAFRQQVAWARAWQKPLVLHIVKAHLEALSLLGNAGPFSAGGLVHAFNASAEVGREYIKLGFLLSVGPQVTRDGYRSLKEAIPTLPAEALVVETDAPDQTPELSGLRDVARRVGELRGTGEEEILAQSRKNLERLLCRE